MKLYFGVDIEKKTSSCQNKLLTPEKIRRYMSLGNEIKFQSGSEDDFNTIKYKSVPPLTYHSGWEELRIMKPVT